MKPARPRSLLIVAWTSIVVGLASAAKIAFLWKRGVISLDLTVFLIPGGVALLRGSGLARELCLLLFSLTAIASGLSLFLLGYLEERPATIVSGFPDAFHLSSHSPLFFAAEFALFAFSVFAWYVLVNKSTRAYCRPAELSS